MLHLNQKIASCVLKGAASQIFVHLRLSFLEINEVKSLTSE